MLAAAEVYAASNQATIITPFILAGAMAPVTVAGVAAQTLAEALAGIAFAQLRPSGAPVVLGSFASSMSMQTGRRRSALPQPALALYTLAALARRLNPPFAAAVRCAREAARCPGCVRERGHAAADDHGWRQLRPPRRRLAGGRAGDRLREVRPRRGSAWDDGGLRQGRRPVTQRPGPRRHPGDPAGQHFLGLRTRWPTSSTPSIAARRRTTRASSSGPRTVPSTPPSGRIGSGNGASPSTRRHRSTRRSTRNCRPT